MGAEPVAELVEGATNPVPDREEAADLDHGRGQLRVVGISLQPPRDAAPHSRERQPLAMPQEKADEVGGQGLELQTLCSAFCR